MILRAVLRGLPRFLSIFAIVALGCGFLVGLFSTCPDMQDTADAYYREYRVMDLDIKGTAGLTEEDRDALLSLPGVESVQAGYSFDLVMTDPNGDDVTSRLWGFSEPVETRVNGFSLTEGRMPRNAFECVLEMPSAFLATYSVGDVFTLLPENVPEGLIPTQFTVVGLAVSPLYMSIEREKTTVGTGQIGAVFYLHAAAFDLPAYTDLVLTFSDANAYNCFSDEYSERMEEKRTAAEALGETRSEARYTELQNEYAAQIARAEESLTAAEGELARRIAEGEQALAAAQKEFSAAENAYLTRFTAMERRYGSEDNFPESVRSSLTEAKGALEAQKDAIKESADALEARRTAGDAALADVREQIAQAKADADALETPRWVLFTRADNASYNSFATNSEKIRSISKVFPVFFCLVAALVAMTSMTRMVEEERTQAGTLGALGYSKGAILRSYLGYCLCACVPGCIVGVLIGSWLFPSVIWKAYSIMFSMPSLQISFRFGYALVAFAVVCGGILLVTWFVCRASLRETPASLMRPRAPVAGKRIFLERISFFWKKLSFHRKVAARNLFRYKKRLYMTVVGVAGCTALLLTGFGLQDSIGSIVDRQFDRVQTYELTVLLREGAVWEEDPTLRAFGEDDLVSGILPVYAESLEAYTTGEKQDVTLYVPLENETFGDYLSLHTPGGDPLSLQDGLLLSQKAAQMLGVSAGDDLRLLREDGGEVTVRVGGVFENYILNFACLLPEQYRELFGSEATPSSMFVKLREDTQEVRDAVAERLYGSENVAYLQFSGELRETFSQMIEKLNFVVYVLIFSAAALAVIVLYNLNNINICERRRELATIKVLGFYEPEVSSYVFRESFVLTLLGDAVGLLLGILLHRFVIQTVELDMVMFGRDISVMSFLLATVLTVVFSLLVSLLSVPVIRKIDMVDSLKANE